MYTPRRFSLAAAALLFVLSAGTPAIADMVAYGAELKGSTEVPANDTKGTGVVHASYDTVAKKFTWRISYSGLTGPAIAAHFHGPAAADANAAPVIPLTGELGSPIKGEATLTDAQAADLQAGLWYFNIHTAAHKPGEIRGQLAKK